MKGDSAHACAKISYPSRNLAKEALKSIARRSGGQGLKAYCCKRCGQWHLGRGRKSKTWRQSKKSQGAGLKIWPR